MRTELRDEIAREIVEALNPEMGKKWDTKMYNQKQKVLKILLKLNIKKHIPHPEKD